MTLFEKVLINLHKGFEKLKRAAALLSERVKFELNVVRMRIRINDIRQRLSELHALIGQRAAEFRNSEAAPETFKEFLEDDEIAAALDEIAKLKLEIDEIAADIAREHEEVIAAAKGTGERKT